jgi:hypothetical protein
MQPLLTLTDTVEEVADPFGLDGGSRKRFRQAGMASVSG